MAGAVCGAAGTDITIMRQMLQDLESENSELKVELKGSKGTRLTSMNGMAGSGAEEGGDSRGLSKLRDMRKRDARLRQAEAGGRGQYASGVGEAKSEEQLNWIIDALQKKDPFTDVPLEYMRHVANAMCLQEVEKGTDVAKEGETGDLAYLLEKGMLVVIADGKEVDTINAGTVFGEVRTERIRAASRSPPTPSSSSTLSSGNALSAWRAPGGIYASAIRVPHFSSGVRYIPCG